MNRAAESNPVPNGKGISEGALGNGWCSATRNTRWVNVAFRYAKDWNIAAFAERKATVIYRSFLGYCVLVSRRLKPGHQRPMSVPFIPAQVGPLAAPLWIALVASVGGCASYQFGSASLYRSGIRTVHVPIVRNETFRHDFGPRLTEALVKEIETRTPYKVTGDPYADSTLDCRVVAESKRVLAETDNDDPRALDSAISVRASWISRSGEFMMQNSVIPTNDLAITFGQDARFVPEAGQSIDTASQAAIDNLAQRIVSQMEVRW